ncbi:2-phosphosulfolactate phosphatase [uncultured Paracoccus sp.]|uniref:2-phosphosulfolactate phosphatase n=1 Tax=uncultured Paracoccus sp. TaxID=189685 RepID=UPI002619923F|nr:2-phosphosulfolactate phosphatase [uncultured Paracoccus sp.]
MTAQVHIEWGRHGVDQAAERCAIGTLVIVDVLSFSTAVDVATSRGAIVFPFELGDRAAAQAYAESMGALCAGRRDEEGPSLAPGSLTSLQAGTRLVLPSPNGSRLSLASAKRPVFAGCLRNARAVADAAAGAADGGDIIVVAAGERWPDGLLRPAIEDWLGAGCIALHLARAGFELTPEAEAATACVAGLSDAGIVRVIAACTSAAELVARGYAADVALAIQIESSIGAPRLIAGGYRTMETDR